MVVFLRAHFAEFPKSHPLNGVFDMSFRSLNPETDRTAFAERRLFEFVGGDKFEPVTDFTRFLEAFHSPGLFFVFEEGSREAAKKAQLVRSKKFGIRPRPKGNLTKPGDYSHVPEEKFGDPVNFKYPLTPPTRIIAALQYFNHPGQMGKGGYNAEEWAKIGRRIVAALGGADRGYSYDSGSKTIKSPSTEE